ncbi:MAG: HEAT repeat domain-containing protein [Thermodesulfobacteriota bacterium]|nr:HEAT repeat domain-containing protein [Thermodesulfobacteriota bacterium]
MPLKHSAFVRGASVVFAIVLAVWLLTACAPWYRAYDIASDEDLTKISAIPELQKALRDSNPDVRVMAAQTLGKIGPDARSALPDLVDVLDDDRYEVRAAGADAIEKIIGPDPGEEDRDLMVRVHINRLESKDWTARLNAANHLAEMGPEGADAVPALVSALLDKSDWNSRYNEVRRAAAHALGEMRFAARAANPALIESSRFHDYDVRLEAVKALGKIGPKNDTTVIEALKASLKDPDFDVRREAANSLGGFEVYADSTVPNLVKALSDHDFDVRREAARSLGRIGPKTDGTVDALLTLLSDEYADVRKAATEALGNVSPGYREKVLPGILPKLDDTDEDVRLAAVNTIAKFRIGNEPVFQSLDRAAHEDQSFKVKKTALETLYVLKGLDAGTAVAGLRTHPAGPAPVAVEAPVILQKTPAKIRSTVDVLNIRSMPSVNSQRIDKLYPNETPLLLETMPDWLKIRKPDGTTGYVFREYTEVVSMGGSAPATMETDAVKATAAAATGITAMAPAAVSSAQATMIRSTADVLNIRSVPDLKGRRVGKLLLNEEADVLESDGDWLKIRKPDGTTGYVFSAYTEVVSGTTAAPEPAPVTAVKPRAPESLPAVSPPAPVETAAVPSVPKLRSTVDALDIYSEPYGSDQVGQLSKEEEAEVIETLAEWVKIKKSDGTTGYVFKEYTSLVNN